MQLTGIFKKLQERSYRPLAALLAIVILIRLPHTASLWLDETITAWILSGHYHQIIERSVNYQGMSALYFLFLEGFSTLCGSAEWILRLPSLLATGCAALLLYRLACELMDEEAAGIALILFIVLDGTVKAANMARPYGFALLMEVSSIYALVRWKRTSRNGWLCAHVLFSVLLVYLQFLFVPALVLNFTFFFLFNERGLPANDARLRRFLVAQLFIAAGLVPAMRQVLLLAAKREAIHFSFPPGIADLFAAVAPPYLLVYLIASVVFSRVYFPFEKFVWRIGPQVKVLILFWALFPPILLFAYSHVSGIPSLVDRFYLWHLPGLALAYAALLRGIGSDRARALVVCVLCAFAMFRECGRRWYIEDWSGVLAHVAAAGDGRALFLYSGLAESEQTEWLEDRERWAYLMAPLSYYRVPQEAWPMPSSFDSSKQGYLQQIAARLAEKGGGLLVALHIKKPTPDGWYFADENIIRELAKIGISAAPEGEQGAVRLYRISPGAEAPS